MGKEPTRIEFSVFDMIMLFLCSMFCGAIGGFEFGIQMMAIIFVLNAKRIGRSFVFIHKEQKRQKSVFSDDIILKRLGLK